MLIRVRVNKLGFDHPRLSNHVGDIFSVRRKAHCGRNPCAFADALENGCNHKVYWLDSTKYPEDQFFCGYKLDEIKMDSIENYGEEDDA